MKVEQVRNNIIDWLNYPPFAFGNLSATKLSAIRYPLSTTKNQHFTSQGTYPLGTS
jgi:hypothetical protein